MRSNNAFLIPLSSLLTTLSESDTSMGQPRPQGAFPWLLALGAGREAREKRPGDEVEYGQAYWCS